jgi:hypothetical protein
MEEKRKDFDSAIDYYAKAFRINHALLDVRVNPRILDTTLVHLALIRAYPNEHTRESLDFQSEPHPWEGYTAVPVKPEAPSPQATPQEIVTPAPPVTEPATQPHPPV